MLATMQLLPLALSLPAALPSPDMLPSSIDLQTVQALVQENPAAALGGAALLNIARPQRVLAFRQLDEAAAIDFIQKFPLVSSSSI